MQDKLVSVIVPVYNVEKYLEKCVNSILLQTYKNIEVILVNDGSTDDSAKICKQLTVKDKRVILINKKNGGQGSARNLGVEKAIGDYIAFVDSDDYIDVNTYEVMVNKIEENKCDLIACQVNMVDAGGKIISRNININKKGPMENGEEAIIRYLKNGRWGVCDKLYNKKIFKNIKFIEGKTHGEDYFVIIQLLQNVKKMITIDGYFYNYFVREGSTSNSKFNDRKFDIVYVWKEVVKQAEEYENKEIIELAKNRLYSASIDVINELIASEWKNIEKEREIFELIRINRFDILKNKYVLKQYKSGTRLICISTKLYKIILRLRNIYRRKIKWEK